MDNIAKAKELIINADAHIRLIVCTHNPLHDHKKTARENLAEALDCLQAEPDRFMKKVYADNGRLVTERNRLKIEKIQLQALIDRQQAELELQNRTLTAYDRHSKDYEEDFNKDLAGYKQIIDRQQAELENALEDVKRLSADHITLKAELEEFERLSKVGGFTKDGMLAIAQKLKDLQAELATKDERISLAIGGCGAFQVWVSEEAKGDFQAIIDTLKGE